MPAFYAHYKFGQMVKNKLPAKYQRLLEDYKDLYEIGLHGPDILFFYHPIIRHPITQIGVVIHHETKCKKHYGHMRLALCVILH